MKVWLFREPPPAWPTGLSVFTEYWFSYRGAECQVFHIEDLEAGKLDADLRDDPANTIVVGGVGAVKKVLARIGRPDPDLPDFPEALLRFAGRRVWDTTMREIHRIVNNEPEKLPLHVKPHRHKLFTGVVVRAFRDLIKTAHVDDDEPILMQEFVEFISEWRCTVLRGDILNVAHYYGDPLRFPDPEIMKEAVQAFTNQPVAFALDWGVTSDGRTLLVEANDAHSLGNYGLRGPDYVNVLIARWRELMGIKRPEDS